MNEQTQTDVEQYLHEVETRLANLTDKNTIINELRSHLWDLANDISLQKSVGVEKAFTLALQQMEDPAILATRFLEEENDTPDTTVKPKSNWIRPATDLPETKISDSQFILLFIAGITMVLTFSALFALVINEPVFFFLSLIVSFIGITAMILFLYVKDQRNYNEQVVVFRQKFQKWTDTNKPKVKKNLSNLRADIDRKKPLLGAIGAHLGGVFAVLWWTFLSIVLLFIHFTNFIPLYNYQIWVPVGFILVFTFLGFELIRGTIQAVVGKVRATRLIDAFVGVVAGSIMITLVVVYPFTMNLVIASATDLVPIPANILMQLSNVNFDLILRFLILISAIVYYITALYNVFKFGVWKSSETKSVLAL